MDYFLKNKQVKLNISVTVLITPTYLFHPNIGAIVQPIDMAQMINILSKAVFFVKGFALKPLTITLYLSKAMKVIVQMDVHPNNDPNIP